MLKKIKFLIIIIFILFLVIRPQLSSECVKVSLEHWYSKVLPALFPSLVLVKIYLSSDYHIGNTSMVCMISGLLCGYPIGATTASVYVKQGKISKEKGLLYASCFNQFSPVFLTAYIGSVCLNTYSITPLLLIYIPQLVLFLVMNHFFDGKATGNVSNNLHKNETFTTDVNYKVVDASIISSCEALIKICGYMVLCNLINTLIFDLSQNRLLYSIIAPALEVTGGVSQLTTAPISSPIKNSYLLACTSFGGLSGILQVFPILKDADLSLKKYIFYKIIGFFITGLVSYIFFRTKSNFY